MTRGRLLDDAVGIRPYRATDLNDLYAIALATGYIGGDAAALYDDPRLIGHVYAAPDAVISPESALVAEDREGVGGYIVGVYDTRGFEDLHDPWTDPIPVGSP